jgi:hypothetical protein
MKEYLVLALMRRQLKYIMMCSLPSITCDKIAPITTSLATMYNQKGIPASSAAMYSRKGIPAICAFITGGEDKYFLMSSKARC